jgi:tetratricopeptide (TPR) repeat protein
MAVLVEGVSIVIRREAIRNKFPGGWESFVTNLPNSTLCYDDRIARVGFMVPEDAEAYIGHLERFGLVYLENDRAVDLAWVGQVHGIINPCDWLEFRQVNYPGGGEVAACWYRLLPADGSEDRKDLLEIATPVGWGYEHSLSKEPGYIPRGDIEKRVKYLRTENRLEVYLDLETEKEVYLGRPRIPANSEAGIFSALERIYQEVKKLEARANKARGEQNPEEATDIYNRLVNELLPEASKIMERTGSKTALSHLVVGLIYRTLEKPEEAELMFRKALFLKPNDLNILLELTRCLGEQKRPQEALPFAEKAVEVSPEDAGAWGNLAVCLIQCGNKQEAKKVIDRAIELDPLDSINQYIMSNFDNL